MCSSLPTGVDTGDIVLFDRSCFSLGIWGGLICTGAKFVGQTEWDHIGVVLRDPVSGELYLAEADLKGVKIRLLHERIKRSRSNKIVIRKLQVNRDIPNFHARAFEFVQDLKTRPYEDRISRFFNAGIVVPARQEREHLSAEIISLVVQKNS